MGLRIDGGLGETFAQGDNPPKKTEQKPNVANMIVDFKHYLKLAEQMDALDGKKDGFVDEAKLIENLTGKKSAKKSGKKPVSIEAWACEMMLNAKKNQDNMKAKKM